MIVALLFVTAVQVAEASWFGAMLSRFHWLQALQTLTFRYLSMILLTFGVGLVFYFIPNAKTRFRDVWVGAVLTGVLWRVAFVGFAWYIRHNSRLDDDPGIDRGGRRVPALDLRVVGHPDVRR